MNILVFVKQVPDDYVKVRLDESGKPAVQAIDRIVNAFDTYAVEMAVRCCEVNGGNVTVASLGEEKQVRPALVQMIAVGAKKAYIGCPALDTPDEFTTAQALAELARLCGEAQKESFDLILCGKESTDEISSQVGAMLAEILHLGFISSAVEFEPMGRGVRVKQETEDGYAVYETACPAVLTVAKPGYDPRYPTLKSKMAARKAEIPCLMGGWQEAKPAVRCLGYAEPPKREAGVKIQEKTAEEAVAKAIAMMAGDRIL